MEANIIQNSSIRKYIFYSLVILTPVGFLCKVYTGPLYGWVQDYLGGVLYEIFWCLLLFFFIPRPSAIGKIVSGVFLVTCILEISQLWKAAFLETIRSYFIGRTLIGTTFSTWDFPHYLIGSAIGWLWLHFLVKKSHPIN